MQTHLATWRRMHRAIRHQPTLSGNLAATSNAASSPTASPARAAPSVGTTSWLPIDPEYLVYESLKPGPGGSVSLLMMPLELIERLAALIPPPRWCRMRRCGRR